MKPSWRTEVRADSAGKCLWPCDMIVERVQGTIGDYTTYAPAANFKLGRSNPSPGWYPWSVLYPSKSTRNSLFPSSHAPLPKRLVSRQRRPNRQSNDPFDDSFTRVSHTPRPTLQVLVRGRREARRTPSASERATRKHPHSTLASQSI